MIRIKKNIAMLNYSDKELAGKGFVNWSVYDHPTLGKVEIGGFIPYIESTPKYELSDSLILKKLPWVYELSEKLPRLSISNFEIKNIGNQLFEIKIYVSNTKYLPFPTAMGEKNKNPAPAIITITGNNYELLSGKKRTAINSLKGNKSIKINYLIKSPKGNKIQFHLKSLIAGSDEKNIVLK